MDLFTREPAAAPVNRASSCKPDTSEQVMAEITTGSTLGWGGVQRVRGDVISYG